MSNERIETDQRYDAAVHSDFLIHWTGKDIDCEHDKDWYEKRTSKTEVHVTELYARRLRDIATYGLWMTDSHEGFYQVASKKITIPSTPHCCFTELKLSESRRHARSYGRLGIGVKRPFLFDRFGRPMAYFGFRATRHRDKFLEACEADLKNQTLLNFFKPMNLPEPAGLDYHYYNESEWRILFFEELLKTRKIIDPRDATNEKEHAYFNSLTENQRSKLKYLIPLDGWFAMIIYPSGQIKNTSQWDTEYGIRKQIEIIKSREDDNGNRVEGLKSPMRGNWPIEVELDSCRHF
jgi:hypothetical protein